MYKEIQSNKRKSWLLILIFILFLLFLGWIFNRIGYGPTGMILAALIAIIMTLVGYYSGDQIALATAGAKPIEKKDNPYLYRIVENLCITSGLPMPKIYIIEDRAMNAFATGRDPKHASVAFTRGLIEGLENEELEGVVAHELSHIKNFDIRLMTLVAVLAGIIVLLSNWMIRIHVFGGSRDRDRGLHPIFLAIGLILIILSPLVAQIIKFAVSRKREYLADASGALLTRFPEGLARALEKISKSQPLKRANNATAHLYISNPFGKTGKFISNLFSTHPPIEDRIRILRNM